MTTKCTMCGSEDLVKLSSQNTKVCSGCGHEEAWPLEDGQQPLVGSHRQKSGHKHEADNPAWALMEEGARKVIRAGMDELVTTIAAARLRDEEALLTQAEREALSAASEAALAQIVEKPEELRRSDEAEELDHVFRAIQVIGQTAHPTIMKRVDCLTDTQRNLFGHKLDRILQCIAPDDSMFSNYQAELRSLSNTIAVTHTCYEKGDEGCPEQVLDANGDVVLSQCKHCGAGESELSQQICTGPAPTAKAGTPRIDPDYIRRSYRFGDVCHEDYHSLTRVLQRAHDQAAYGKGKERHANDLPFEKQRMQTISRLLDSPDGMAYQVVKKVTEGLTLPERERQVAELLGAINYLAGIVVFLESKDRASAVNIIAGAV